MNTPKRILDGVTLLLVMSALTACALSDIRPQTLKTETALEPRQRRGRALMKQVAEHYGVEAWRAHTTLDVVMEDRWPNALVQEMLGWWPQHPQHLRMQAQVAHPSVQAELLDGQWEGQRHGLHQGQSWHEDSQGEVTWEQNQLSTFYLVSLQYFNELPFQLAQADVILHAGEQQLRGQTYHQVLVSWREAKPHQGHDQYLLWINARTLNIDICTYTVREAFAGATGTIHFADFRRVQGVLLPFQQRVVLDPPQTLPEPTEDDAFHETRIQSAVFDTFPASALHRRP